jgi:hypothetical protein
MLTHSLPTNATLFCETRTSQLPQAVVPHSTERRARPDDERADHDEVCYRQGALMHLATRYLPLLALLAAPLCGSAQAMDYEVGTSLVCDTQTQVERFVALFSGGAQAAIDAVNAEEQNPTACALVNVAYLRGSHIGIARNGDNAFEIVRILVVGIDTAGGIRAVRPSAYFSLFGVKEYAV